MPQDFDSNLPMASDENPVRLFLSGLTVAGRPLQQKRVLTDLMATWEHHHERPQMPDEDWFNLLNAHLQNLVLQRANTVQNWVLANTERFAENASALDNLKREVDTKITELKSNVQLCGLKCARCNLLCLEPRHHEGGHTCQTSHKCIHDCHFVDEHTTPEQCGLPYVSFLSKPPL